MARSTDHLLRTLAAISPGSKILVLGSGSEFLLDPLGLLGFDVSTMGLGPTDVVETGRERADLAALDPDAVRPSRVVVSNPQSFPDERFDWIVLFETHPVHYPETDLPVLFRELYRVLKTGAWLFVLAPWSFPGTDGNGLGPYTEAMALAGFVPAEKPAAEETSKTYGHVIFRKVDALTPP